MQKELKKEVEEILNDTKQPKVSRCVQCYKVFKMESMKKVDFGKRYLEEKIAEMCKTCYNEL